MTSYYVIVTTKLCSEVGNDEYIVLCIFGGRGMSGFEVIENRLLELKKMTFWLPSSSSMLKLHILTLES